MTITLAAVAYVIVSLIAGFALGFSSSEIPKRDRPLLYLVIAAYFGVQALCVYYSFFDN